MSPNQRKNLNLDTQNSTQIFKIRADIVIRYLNSTIILVYFETWLQVHQIFWSEH